MTLALSLLLLFGLPLAGSLLVLALQCDDTPHSVGADIDLADDSDDVDSLPVGFSTAPVWPLPATYYVFEFGDWVPNPRHPPATPPPILG